jgi:Flp pilus assembly protein TadG
LWRTRRRLREERGVVLVEFAIVLPILLLVLLGIIDFGRVMNYGEQQQQLAAQAARMAAVNADPPGSLQINEYVESQALGGLSGGGDVTSGVQVYIYYPTGSTGSTTTGQPIRACAVADFQLLPLLRIGGITTLKLVQTATMRTETTPTTPNFTTVSTTTAAGYGCPTS